MRSLLASRPLALALLPLRLLVVLVFGPLVLLRLLAGSSADAGVGGPDPSEAIYQAKRNLMYPSPPTARVR